MKGGSVASDSVTSLVKSTTFDQMNTMFDNQIRSKVGGGCPCGTGKSSRCSFHSTRGGNGNTISKLLGTGTMEAFKSGGSGGSGGHSLMNAASRIASLPELMSSNSSSELSIKNRQSGGGKKVATKAKKAPVTKTRCDKNTKGAPMRGGDNAKGATEIGPKLNFDSYSFSTKTPPSSTAIDIMASEGVSSVPLMQKTTSFGNIVPTLDSPFSFTSPTSLAPYKAIPDTVVSGANLSGGAQNKAKKAAPPKMQKNVKPPKKSTPPAKATATQKQKQKKLSALESLFKKLGIRGSK